MTRSLENQKKKKVVLLDYYLKMHKKYPLSKYFVPLADVYRSLDLLDEALEILQEGLKWHPNYGVGRALLAQTYHQMGRFSEAAFEAERVLQNDPKNLLAKNIFLKLSQLKTSEYHALKSPLGDFQIHSLIPRSPAPSKSKKVAFLELLLKKIQTRAQLS
ncbi:MAG: tetratricopeptide repeat protein [Deltaproteobacteria bacterium]|nr:tetratricopeptide repeat protein [Deltaproteobacteria bacterium]